MIDNKKHGNGVYTNEKGKTLIMDENGKIIH